MAYVKHIVAAINVFDITVVIVAPAYWPSFIVPERIAAILEAVIPADHLGTPHVEGVALTEMGTVIGVRDAAIIAPASAATAVAGNGLRLLPCGLSRLCALRLRLLGTLWLRLALCLLRALWLRLLGTLRLRLALRRLGALRLRLVLGWLRFLSAAALLLVAFLGEGRKGGSEKH